MIKVNRFLMEIMIKNSLKQTKKWRKNYPPHGLFEERIDVPYMSDHTHRHSFDIYYAKENIKNIVIIDIHGGSYMYGDHLDNYILAIPFLKEGFDFITVDYIPNNGKMDTKDLIDDCVRCINYIFAHQKELGIEGKRFAITGDSAGGHFALTIAEAICDKEYAKRLGYEFPDVKLIACLLNCPVYNFAHVGDGFLTRSGMKRMFGPHYNDIEAVELICPKVNIDSLTCPLFVSTCSQDFLRQHSLLLKEDMEKRNHNYELLDIQSDDKNIGHVHNVLIPDHPLSQKVNNAMMDFIMKNQ